MKNTLLLTVDSFRYDTSQRCDPRSLPNNTLSFQKAFATGPGTSPSFPSLLCGTLPLFYGGLGPLSDDRPRLSAELRDAGLATAGFQCNPFLSRHFNYDRGFDAFEDYQHPLMGVATRIFPRGIELNNPKLATVDDLLHLTDAIKWAYRLVAGKPRPYVSAEVITDDAVEWLANAEEPFFCWAHYMDVHHPCFPPREYRVDHGVEGVDQAEVADAYSALVRDPDELTPENIDALQRLYRAAIEYTTDQVDRLFDRLAAAGRLDDTLIILTSDHGELFGEHGEYGKPERMYDELLHVPLLIANGPDYLENAQDDLVSLLDLPPLIHDALGLDVPDAYEGRIPGKDEPREHVMAEHEVGGDVIVGARSENWLYEADEIRGEHRLFDCRDGFERVSLEATEEGEPGRLRRAALDRLDELNVEPRRLEDEVEGDVRGRLEDLGYL